MWRDSIARSSIADAAVVLSSGIVVASAFSLVFWTLPLADDFCFAGVQTGWPQFVAQRYWIWSGRWATMGLYGGVWPRLDITSVQYSVALAVVWIGLLGSLIALVRLVWGRHTSLATSAAGALVLAALFLCGLPVPGDSLYWLTGIVPYTLPIPLSILCVTALVRAAEHPPGHPSSRAWNILGLVLVVAVTGLHELAALTLLLVLVAIATLARVEGVQAAARWRTAALVAAVGCLVTVVAPGNTVRLNKDFADAVVTVPRAADTLRLQITTYLVPWLTDVRLVLASVLLLTSSWFKTSPLAQRSGRTRLVVVPVVAAVSVLIPFLVMAVKIGAVGPSRLYSYLYGVFLAGWLVSLAVWSGRLRLPTAASDVGTLRAAVAALFVLGLFSAPRMLGYLGDLTGKETVMRFHRETARIHRSFRAASQAGAQEVSAPALPRVPASFLVTWIGPDPSHWHNRCVANYFGLERVRLGPGGNQSFRSADEAVLHGRS